MSNQKKSDEEELLAEFEKMLSEGGCDYDEEDFGYFSLPHPSRFNPYYDSDSSFEEPPEVPKEARCEHRNKRKAGLTTLFWYCPDCKKDLGNV